MHKYKVHRNETYIATVEANNEDEAMEKVLYPDFAAIVDAKIQVDWGNTAIWKAEKIPSND